MWIDTDPVSTDTDPVSIDMLSPGTSPLLGACMCFRARSARIRATVARDHLRPPVG